jgi:glycosyltransferase involved in cell wall biosynthesis
MHILFLSDNFPPEVNAPASRTYEHCREWVQLGHKVTVITGAPNFPAGKVFEGYRNRLWSREAVDGIDVVRVWTYIAANQGVLKRSLDYVSFMLTAVPASLAIGNVDIIVGTSPQLFTPCAAYIASLFKRRPFVFELRDLWPESIKAVEAIKTSRLLDALERLELFLYRRAAHIVCVTQSFEENLVCRGIARDKISVTLNGADLSRFKPQPRDEALVHSLGLDGKLVVGYVGTHGMAHGLSTLLAAAGQISSDPALRHVRFLFLGDGAQKAALQAEARVRGLGNVLFLDSVSRDQVPSYWSLIDLAVIHLRRTPLFETVIPSKLFECMAMGIPVLHGVAGESKRIVESEGVGVAFEPENAEALAGLIGELSSDAPRRTELARRSAEAAGKYDRKAMAAAMLSTLIKVAHSSPNVKPFGAERCPAIEHDGASP